MSPNNTGVDIHSTDPELLSHFSGLMMSSNTYNSMSQLHNGQQLNGLVPNNKTGYQEKDVFSPLGQNQDPGNASTSSPNTVLGLGHLVTSNSTRNPIVGSVPGECYCVLCLLVYDFYMSILEGQNSFLCPVNFKKIFFQF